MAFPGPRSRAEPRGFARPAAVAPGEASYPARLGALSSPPAPLWYKGRLPANGGRAIAMVGARAATANGCGRARELAAALGARSFAIVSGGAFGIDAACHEGALAAGAATYAVLGCGTDVVYPDRHAGLFSRIAERGGLLSEYPPGTRPKRGHFPARNRLIAALGEAVIVVEAARRSGALITAAVARRLGRPLLALPDSPGTDALLRHGRALPVTSADDVEAALAGELVVPPPSAPAEGAYAELLAAIESGASTPGLLCQRLGLRLPDLLATLAEAELDGLVERVGGDTYEVLHGPC